MKNLHASEQVVTVVIVCGIVVIAVAGLVMSQQSGVNAQSVSTIVTVGIAALGLQPRTRAAPNPSGNTTDGGATTNGVPLN